MTKLAEEADEGEACELPIAAAGEAGARCGGAGEVGGEQRTPQAAANFPFPLERQLHGPTRHQGTLCAAAFIFLPKSIANRDGK